MLAVGAAYSALVLVIWHPDQRLLIALAVGSTLPARRADRSGGFSMADARAARRQAQSDGRAKIGRIGMRAIAIGWVTISLGWLLQGMSLWATLRAMGATPRRPTRRTVAAHDGRGAGRRGRLSFADSRRSGHARVGFGRVGGTSLWSRRCDRFGDYFSARAASVGARDFDYSIWAGWRRLRRPAAASRTRN